MSIQYINVTDEPLVMTSGHDKYVHIFALSGELRGTLKQGYMTKNPYLWDFGMKNYDKKLPQRKEAVYNSVFKEENDKESIKRREKVMIKRQASAGGLGCSKNNFMNSSSATQVKSMVPGNYATQQPEAKSSRAIANEQIISHAQRYIQKEAFKRMLASESNNTSIASAPQRPSTVGAGGGRFTRSAF